MFLNGTPSIFLKKINFVKSRVYNCYIFSSFVLKILLKTKYNVTVSRKSRKRNIINISYFNSANQFKILSVRKKALNICSKILGTPTLL